MLLIRLRSIGDTVLMTPCLSALKSWSPTLKISVVSEPLSAPLLEDHPLVDELLIAESSVIARTSLIAKLRGRRFDLAFNMHGGPTAAILARLSGARRCVGYRGLPLSSLLTDRAPSPGVILERSRIHSVEQQLALMKWVGVEPDDSRLALSLQNCPDIEARMSERLREMGLTQIASIVPGAAFESKRWGAEGFAAVADHLMKRWDLPSVIVAGPGQEQLAREVVAAAKVKTTMLTGLTLKELMAVLRMSRLFVGNDSGPMHIAAAFHRPIVAVWGSSNETVWHPWTSTAYSVVKGEHSHSIKQIPSSEVIKAVDEVLELALEASPTADAASQSRQAKLV